MTNLFKSTKTVTTTIEVDEDLIRSVTGALKSDPSSVAAGVKAGFSIAGIDLPGFSDHK